MVKIQKVYTRNYTVIENTPLNDIRLHLADKGLFSYLWSQSNEWNFYAKEVAKHSADGVDGVNTALGHLEEFGYLYRGRVRNEKGQLKGSKWLLSETPKKEWIDYYQKKSVGRKKKPIRENPKQAKPKQGEPIQDNPDLTSTNQNKYSHKQVKNLNKSLSKKEKERDKNMIDILINYLNYRTEELHRAPIIFSANQYKDLVKAVHDKEPSLLRSAVDQTLVNSTDYPQGYLLSCIKNLPDMKAGNLSG